jgi:transcriptional antiterminator NusG
MIYTVKTIVGREDIVLEAILNKGKSQQLEIKAGVHPEEIKGYVFVEGNLRDIENVIRTIPHARGIIRKPISVEEIGRFLEPRKVEIELNEGDVVEVIGGPFKGEKGKITRFDKTKGEATIELLEVTVPIPITISAEFVKVLEKAKKS